MRRLIWLRTVLHAQARTKCAVAVLLAAHSIGHAGAGDAAPLVDDSGVDSAGANNLAPQMLGDALASDSGGVQLAEGADDSTPAAPNTAGSLVAMGSVDVAADKRAHMGEGGDVGNEDDATLTGAEQHVLSQRDAGAVVHGEAVAEEAAVRDESAMYDGSPADKL